MTWGIGGNGVTEPGWDTAWANWAINWVPQFARHSSRKPVLRQALQMVAGACNHPNLLVLPFSVELIRAAA